jgi:2-dehydro-3-deoxyphosphooctonate aldolase (KDO 8-P synthase)
LLRRQFEIGRGSGTPARVGGDAALLVIAGPCVLEDETMVLRTAATLADVCRDLGFGFVFKCSYLKDNRTAAGSFVGPGMDAGLELLTRVRREVGVPVLSDVHERSEVGPASEVLDVLQIPAFLSRQTRLVAAAAATGKCVNVKKGQFLAPEDVQHIVGKYEAATAEAGISGGGLLVTERGTSFGYRELVVDMRGLAIMREFGWPVVFDVTHSLQRPAAAGHETGGDRRFAPLMARAACAAGVDALFLEAHPDPARARSDRATQIPLSEVRALLAAAREHHLLERQARESSR